MSDDVTSSAVSHGLALIAGSGASGLSVRPLFGSFAENKP